ncbi:g10703 [Coccomyxa viridis]|uniref:G10703 protein n=1 Tax=Coccomyxa viridis TaxID=1274662 RepID=A0ABP1G8L6_9CHLO
MHCREGYSAEQRIPQIPGVLTTSLPVASARGIGLAGLKVSLRHAVKDMRGSLGGPHGYVPHHAHLPECPLLTSVPATHGEVASGIYAEPIKAYKLGKGRQSYNMLNVQLYDANDGSRRLEATHAARLEQDGGENGAAFLVQYKHGICLKLVFHLVYSTAEPFQYQDQSLYQWRLVCRDHCHANCPGPILRPISRLGRNGKHSNLPQNKQMNPNGSKDSRYVYLSIDEASSHIGSIRHTFFRLVVGAYDSEDGRLVGTSCSEPIVCISNNDVPKNAPYLPMHIPVSSAWPKWQLVPQQPPAAPVIPAAPAAAAPLAPAAAPPRAAAAAATAAPAHAAAPALAAVPAAVAPLCGAARAIAFRAAPAFAFAAAQRMQIAPAKAPAPAPPSSPGRSASPRSATSQAYLSQPLPPCRTHPTLQPSLVEAPKEWEGDSEDPQEEIEDPRPGAPISSIEEAARAADAFADADAAAALQAMIALRRGGPRSSANTQHMDHAHESMATVPRAPPKQAGDGTFVHHGEAEVADVMHSYHPNPESYPCSRAKKMRLLSAVYLSPAAD